MGKAIAAEFIKVRKNKIFVICSLIILTSAGFIVVKDLFFVPPPDDYYLWIMSSYMVTALMFSIMSGFVLTFLVQREYEDKTIVNVLSAPTSRFVFLLSKLAVWFVWYAVILLMVEIIYIIGGSLIYPDTFGVAGVRILVRVLTKSRMLGFVVSIPLLWIAVMQKKMFYPSIMVALVFGGIELSALNMPIQAASVIPWSAVPLVSLFEATAPYTAIGISSIILTGLTGVILSYISFRKQDQ